LNILVTGGFGSIGVVVVDECLRRGHAVSVFEVRDRRTEKLARKYVRRNVKVPFGDLRNKDDVSSPSSAISVTPWNSGKRSY
jgi:nucleoside-diphosphate-sugar epimerase